MAREGDHHDVPAAALHGNNTQTTVELERLQSTVQVKSSTCSAIAKTNAEAPDTDMSDCIENKNDDVKLKVEEKSVAIRELEGIETMQPKNVVEGQLNGAILRIKTLQKEFLRFKENSELKTQLSQERTMEDRELLNNIHEYSCKTYVLFKNAGIRKEVLDRILRIIETIKKWRRNSESDPERQVATLCACDEVLMLRKEKAALIAVNAGLKRNLSTLELRHGQMSSASGSYAGNSATPTLVSETFRRVSFLVKNCSTRLRRCVPWDSIAEVVTRDYPNVFFLRSAHAHSATLNAEVMSILFEGFENESFTPWGVSMYPNPVKRQKAFFSLFLGFQAEGGGVDYASKNKQNPCFFQYYKRRCARVMEHFEMERSHICYNYERLEDFKLAFWKAAKVVWCLHLLSFSFEPPASLFRVSSEADFDSDYMETSPLLGEEARSFTKVAFMIVPGLRVGKVSTIKSQIYPVMPVELYLGAHQIMDASQ